VASPTNHPEHSSRTWETDKSPWLAFLISNMLPLSVLLVRGYQCAFQRMSFAVIEKKGKKYIWKIQWQKKLEQLLNLKLLYAGGNSFLLSCERRKRNPFYLVAF
jgi:hypothetical protein